MMVGSPTETAAVYDISSVGHMAGAHGDSKRLTPGIFASGKRNDSAIPNPYPFGILSAINDQDDAAGRVLTADGKHAYGLWQLHRAPAKLFGAYPPYTDDQVEDVSENGMLGLT